MLEVIKPDEQITVNSYQQLCDSVWDGESEPDSGVVYVQTEFIHKFFQKCRKNLYVVVSGCCDYSVVEQEKNHPNSDLWKWVQAMDWKTIVNSKGTYGALQLGPACEPKNCIPSDRYSVKIYAHTLSTFPEVPENVVAWFCTNLGMKHPRVHWLPFGLNDDGDGLGMLPDFMGKPKRRMLYLNFQPHTEQRLMLKRYYAEQQWVTLQPKANVPIGQFLNEVADHQFTLCPTGNGLDCYRTYEALYLGSIPVLEESDFASHFEGLPVLIVPDLFALTPEFLDEQNAIIKSRENDMSRLKISHWEKEVDRWRQKLAAV